MDKAPRGDLRGNPFREGVAGQFAHQAMQVETETAELPPADDIREEGIGEISQGRQVLMLVGLTGPGSLENPAAGEWPQPTWPE